MEGSSPAGEQPARLIKSEVATTTTPIEPPNSGSSKTPAAAGGDEAMMMEDGSDESDNGPYCLCRGPDDHRWMICCERCEDWFHGECINLDKSIGESLIEKFVCPNCTTESVSTIYKKTCSLPSCRKPARIALGGSAGSTEQSVFCSDEHTQAWWEHILARMPRDRSRTGLTDQLTQEEFMALLSSGLATIGSDGMLRLATMPFQDGAQLLDKAEGSADDPMLQIMTEEERSFLDSSASSRYQLAQEMLLCDHMITLIELAQKRRRAAIDAGRIGDDICGYDDRLDTISARDAFAAFVKSPEGETVFRDQHLGNPPAPPGQSNADSTEDGGGVGDDDDDGMTRGMCTRKRCKAHSGWQKMLVFGVKYQIRELAEQASEVSDEERVVKEAATERWRRKEAERNWVEVIDGC
ncbi:COMPASS component SPP1 [Geosmithia morbida]|uniref:COMPASS component SPP1 n=1 Tax=Geosmithia morbida TaxID=1094350 RepID=A0A9P4YX09_9HYPO|nr:COMPASS component SPP1 [Geosmithia morbida]KAF4124410.1 COMPASS component SPP1 [Geosmithia morbida]